MNINLFWVYFVYGLAFFCMGLALMIESSRSPAIAEAKVLIPLAIFGIIHGVHEWLDMVLLKADWFQIAAPTSYSGLRLALLTLSFTFLIAFGVLSLRLSRNALHRRGWLVLGLALAFVLVIVMASYLSRGSRLAWSARADVIVRYSLAVPGALLAGYALYVRSRGVRQDAGPRLATSLLVVALCFAIYACTQAIVAPGEVFPASLLNTARFTSWLGFPVQILRATLAVTITAALLYAVQYVEKERERLLLSAQQARFEALQQVERELKVREAMREELLHHIVQAQEEERSRIARELHDETAQVLTAFSYSLAALKETVPASPKSSALIEHLQNLRQQMAHGIYRMMRDLRPPQLDDLGLVAALEYQAAEDQQRLGLNVDLRVEGVVQRLDPMVETVLFRIAQEALTNVARHAQVQQAALKLRYEPEQVILSIQDHGSGFRFPNPPQPGQNLGLTGMQERAESIGGHLKVTSAPGNGTYLELIVPLTPAARPVKETENGFHPNLTGR